MAAHDASSRLRLLFGFFWLSTPNGSKSADKQTYTVSAMQFYCAEPQQLLDVLRRSRSDAYAVRRVCIELTRLVLANASVRIAVVAHDHLLSTLVLAVDGHVDAHELVLADCCRLLRRLINLRGR